MADASSRVLPKSLELWEWPYSGAQSLSTPELSSSSTSSDDNSSLFSGLPSDSSNFGHGSAKKSVDINYLVSPTYRGSSMVGLRRFSEEGDLDFIHPQKPHKKPQPLLIPDIYPLFPNRSPRLHIRKLLKPRPAALRLNPDWFSLDSLSTRSPNGLPNSSDTPPVHAPVLPEFPGPFGQPSVQTPTNLTHQKVHSSPANVTTGKFLYVEESISTSPRTSRGRSFFNFGRRSSMPHFTYRRGTEQQAEEETALVSAQQDRLTDRSHSQSLNPSSPRHVQFHDLSIQDHPVWGSSTEVNTPLASTGESPSSGPLPVYQRARATDNLLCAFEVGSPTLKSGWRSTWSLAEEAEDEDERENQKDMSLGLTSPFTPVSSRYRLLRHDRQRRWTVSAAITNEDFLDVSLVDEVENVKPMREGQGSPTSPLPSFENQDRDNANSSVSEKDKHDDEPLTIKSSLPSLCDPALSVTWQLTRRALLTCRELVRTERHYLSALHILVSKETQSSPPALMLTYLPALVRASESLLKKMEENPTAQGVADAFVAEKEQLETAFVAWSGVVGDFFAGEQGPAVNLANPLISRVGPWKKRFRSVSAPGLRIEVSPMLTLVGGKETANEKGKPAVRDLAILPSQRVMRYVSLYKELLHTTSTSTSHAAVERAMLAAIAIAQICDRAQDNAVFLRE